METNGHIYGRIGAWRHSQKLRRFAKMLAAVALAYVFWQTVIAFPNLLGVESNAPIAWILPGLYAVVFVIGLIWAFTLKARQPAVYEAIGLGAAAVTGIPAADMHVPAPRTSADAGDEVGDTDKAETPAQ